MKILIVDDEHVTRVLLKKFLNRCGYNDIIEADDGTVAMDLLKKEDVGLIFSDLAMPDMNGLEFLRTVRAIPKYATVPFLMVTAHTDKESIIQAVKSGVNGYIVKPFNQEKLQEKINEVLQQGSSARK